MSLEVSEPSKAEARLCGQRNIHTLARQAARQVCLMN